MLALAVLLGSYPGVPRALPTEHVLSAPLCLCCRAGFYGMRKDHELSVPCGPAKCSQKRRGPQPKIFPPQTDKLLGAIATDSSLSIWRIPLSPAGPSLALGLAWASPSPRGNLEIPGHQEPGLGGLANLRLLLSLRRECFPHAC